MTKLFQLKGQQKGNLFFSESVELPQANPFEPFSTIGWYVRPVIRVRLFGMVWWVLQLVNNHIRVQNQPFVKKWPGPFSCPLNKWRCISNIVMILYCDSLKGPIFSEAVFKCRWLLEHENLSKVSKYTGKFLNSISQISESISKSFFGFCRSLGFFCK